MDWIIDNYKWVFSGLGVFLISYIILFFNKRQRTNKFSIKNINVGNKAQVFIFKSEADVQISSLKDIYSHEIPAKTLQEKQTEKLGLITEPTGGEEIYDVKSRKAIKLNNEAVKLSREGRYNEALIKIRKAVNIDPEDDVYKNNLINITENYASSLIFDSDLCDEAIPLIEQLKKDGLLSDGYGFWLLGYAYSHKRLYEQSISAYRQATVLEPRDFQSHLHLALAYNKKGLKDDDLNYQKKALREGELSLGLNPQQIMTDAPLSSLAEIVILSALIEIAETDNLSKIKTDYEHLLIRTGCYSSEQIDKLIDNERFSTTLATVALGLYISRLEEKIGGTIDDDTLINGVKSVNEIQAMVKESTGKEIPITAISTLLRMTQLKDEEEVMKLATDLIRNFGEDEVVTFWKSFVKVIGTRKEWIISEIQENCL